ncbi:MAG: sel1 repeat family protein, partial [Zoogloeaceae bacterium]|nr:sel1 repeat family protein [Zoogloeaceae bacterium]
AVRWFRIAAEQGFAKAQCNLGHFYLDGKGGLKEDANEAIRWFRLAAEQGIADAQHILDRCHYNPAPIENGESPREVLAAHFDGYLPIRGGWGYSRKEACIINRDDPLVDPSIPFHGVGVEYDFVKQRIYEEMIISRPKCFRFRFIRWDIKRQCLHDKDDEDGKLFDELVFDITARDGRGQMVRFTRDFWFDITSFYGKQGGIFNIDGIGVSTS